MNNEPVAWIVDGKIVYPAKTLTPITDEEIKERVKNSINGDWVDGYYDGVRWAEEKTKKGTSEMIWTFLIVFACIYICIKK